MSDLINISFGDAALTALLGYLVVFFGLVLLMVVVIIMGKIMVSRANKAKAAAPAAPAASTPAPCRKLRRLSSMRPRLLVKAAFWASFKRGSFLSTFSPFLLSWLPRLGAVAGDGRLLGCQAVCRRGLVVRLLERPDYGATWAP